MKKITITIEDDNDYENTNMTDPFRRIGINWPSISPANDNGWVDGRNICDNCPNRPYGPNNKSGFCNCTIPSMYGPLRVTC